MATIELRFNCSDHMLETIDMLRGVRTREDFIIACMQVGLGHFEEESIKFHRERLYEVASFTTDQFRKALESREITKGFSANDITRPKAASS